MNPERDKKQDNHPTDEELHQLQKSNLDNLNELNRLMASQGSVEEKKERPLSIRELLFPKTKPDKIGKITTAQILKRLRWLEENHNKGIDPENGERVMRLYDEVFGMPEDEKDENNDEKAGKILAEVLEGEANQSDIKGDQEEPLGESEEKLVHFFNSEESQESQSPPVVGEKPGGRGDLPKESIEKIPKKNIDLEDYKSQKKLVKKKRKEKIDLMGIEKSAKEFGKGIIGEKPEEVPIEPDLASSQSVSEALPESTRSEENQIEPLPNYYDIFGIDPTLTGDDFTLALEQAFLEKNGQIGDEVGEDIQDKVAEYLRKGREILLDPVERVKYDKILSGAEEVAVKEEVPVVNEKEKSGMLTNKEIFALFDMVGIRVENLKSDETQRMGQIATEMRRAHMYWNRREKESLKKRGQDLYGEDKKKRDLVEKVRSLFAYWDYEDMDSMNTQLKTLIQEEVLWNDKERLEGYQDFREREENPESEKEYVKRGNKGKSEPDREFGEGILETPENGNNESTEQKEELKKTEERYRELANTVFQMCKNYKETFEAGDKSWDIEEREKAVGYFSEELAHIKDLLEENSDTLAMMKRYDLLDTFEQTNRIIEVLKGFIIEFEALLTNFRKQADEFGVSAMAKKLKEGEQNSDQQTQVPRGPENQEVRDQYKKEVEELRKLIEEVEKNLPPQRKAKYLELMAKSEENLASLPQNLEALALIKQKFQEILDEIGYENKKTDPSQQEADTVESAPGQSQEQKPEAKEKDREVLLVERTSLADFIRETWKDAKTEAEKKEAKKEIVALLKKWQGNKTYRFKGGKRQYLQLKEIPKNLKPDTVLVFDVYEQQENGKFAQLDEPERCAIGKIQYREFKRVKEEDLPKDGEEKNWRTEDGEDVKRKISQQSDSLYLVDDGDSEKQYVDEKDMRAYKKGDKIIYKKTVPPLKIDGEKKKTPKKNPDTDVEMDMGMVGMNGDSLPYGEEQYGDVSENEAATLASERKESGEFKVGQKLTLKKEFAKLPGFRNRKNILIIGLLNNGYKFKDEVGKVVTARVEFLERYYEPAVEDSVEKPSEKEAFVKEPEETKEERLRKLAEENKKKLEKEFNDKLERERLEKERLKKEKQLEEDRREELEKEESVLKDIYDIRLENESDPKNVSDSGEFFEFPEEKRPGSKTEFDLDEKELRETEKAAGKPKEKPAAPEAKAKKKPDGFVKRGWKRFVAELKDLGKTVGGGYGKATKETWAPIIEDGKEAADVVIGKPASATWRGAKSAANWVGEKTSRGTEEDESTAEIEEPVVEGGGSGKYQYEAMDATGGEVKGTVFAESEEEAQRKIRGEGYFVTRITEIQKPKGIWSTIKKHLTRDIFGRPSPLEEFQEDHAKEEKDKAREHALLVERYYRALDKAIERAQYYLNALMDRHEESDERDRLYQSIRADLGTSEAKKDGRNAKEEEDIKQEYLDSLSELPLKYKRRYEAFLAKETKKKSSVEKEPRKINSLADVCDVLGIDKNSSDEDIAITLDALRVKFGKTDKERKDIDDIESFLVIDLLHEEGLLGEHYLERIKKIRKKSK